MWATQKLMSAMNISSTIYATRVVVRVTHTHPRPSPPPQQPSPASQHYSHGLVVRLTSRHPTLLPTSPPPPPQQPASIHISVAASRVLSAAG